MKIEYYIKRIRPDIISKIEMIHPIEDKPLLLTYKVKHNHDFSTELEQAKQVAEYAINRRVSPSQASTAAIRHIGLKSAIANQILRKYGRDKKTKSLKNIKLVIPAQAIRTDRDKRKITIIPLKFSFQYLFPNHFETVNQIEIDDTYCYVSCKVYEQTEMIPQSFIGVDRNTTGHVLVLGHPETGKVWKLGKQAHYIHKKYSHLRKNLQKKGKFKYLQKIKDKESRIVRDINHKVTRKASEIAKSLNAGMVLEDLAGIRQTSKSNRSFRYSLNSWSFYQQELFLLYKNRLLGVPTYYIEPAYTSQKCSRCGQIGIRYRKEFWCPHCGHFDHADANASFNVALAQYDVVNRTQTEMCTMGALIPRWSSASEGEATLEPPML